MAKNGKKGPSKSEIMKSIADTCEMSRKQIAAVFNALQIEIKKCLKGGGTFAIPGLVKIEKKKVPARPARKNVPNPFKPGEVMDVAAKPASVKVKVRALKALKEMVK